MRAAAAQRMIRRWAPLANIGPSTNTLSITSKGSMAQKPAAADAALVPPPRKWGSMLKLTAGDVLMRQGDRPVPGFSDSMFVLLSGSMRALVQVSN